jgi:hypothetical protein
MTDKETTIQKQKGFKTVLSKLAPWVIAIVVLYLVFQRVSIIDVLNSARQVNLMIFLPLLIYSLVVHFLWDSQVYTLLFRWFGVPVTFREMLPVRGASHLLILLNFFVGQGGMALMMNRWKGISIGRAGSIILFSVYNDYYLLLAFCLFGAFRLPGVDLASFFHGTEEGDLVRFIIISWVVFILLIAYLRLYLTRPGARLRMKEREIFSSFREAPVSLYFKLMAVKAVSSISGLFTCYFALMAFDLYVPLEYLVVFLPLVLLISSIPLTGMGLGTTQAPMLWLVAGFAQGGGGPEAIKAAVLAYSLLWWFSYSAGRFGIGAFFLFRLPKSIWTSQEADSTELTFPEERQIRPAADA